MGQCTKGRREAPEEQRKMPNPPSLEGPFVTVFHRDQVATPSRGGNEPGSGSI